MNTNHAAIALAITLFKEKVYRHVNDGGFLAECKFFGVDLYEAGLGIVDVVNVYEELKALREMNGLEGFPISDLDNILIGYSNTVAWNG